VSYFLHIIIFSLHVTVLAACSGSLSTDHDGLVHITYYGNKDGVLLQQLCGLTVTTHTLSIGKSIRICILATWLVMIELGMCIACRCYSVTYTLLRHIHLWYLGIGKFHLLPAGRLVLRLLCVFRVCWYICASALITCAIITSRSLHCCHPTLLSGLWQFRRLLCVTTVSSLAQLRVRDGY